jgi:hypothetical protein
MAVSVYSNCTTLTSGCFLYDNSNLTSPASNGKYSDGFDCYTVSGGNGEITSVSACSSSPSYNYYTLTPCTGGSGTDYRSILALALNDVYTFLPYGPGESTRACYEITDIAAASNTNDLPTIYGPVVDDCASTYCVQV